MVVFSLFLVPLNISVSYEEFSQVLYRWFLLCATFTSDTLMRNMNFLIFFLVYFLTLALGNIGFEYEFSLYSYKQPHKHMGSMERQESDVFGWKERQKPIATGFKGLWELQMDSASHKVVDLEIVTPPSRLYKGMPLNDAKNTICSVQKDLGEFLNRFHTNTGGIYRGMMVPFSSSVFTREYKETPFLLLDNYPPFRGHLQATIGVRLDEFKDFCVFLFESGKYLIRDGEVFALLREVLRREFSPRLYVVLFFVSLYYSESHMIRSRPSDFKFFAKISSRTNLASVFEGVDEEMRQKGMECTPFSLSETVKDIVRNVYPKLEFTDAFAKIGFGEEIDGTLQEGPSLVEYFENLFKGIDLIASYDESMSYIDLKPKGEIVIEFRRLLDYRSIVPGLLTNEYLKELFMQQQRDVYAFFSAWERKERVSYSRGMGDHLCDNHQESRRKDEEEGFHANLLVSTNLMPSSPFSTRHHIPYHGAPIAAGPAGIWELTWNHGFLSFLIGSTRLYYYGLDVFLKDYDSSLKEMIAFIDEMRISVQNAVGSNQNNHFDINVIGTLPRSKVPLPVSLLNDEKELTLNPVIYGYVRPEKLFVLLGRVVQASEMPTKLILMYNQLVESTASDICKGILLMMAFGCDNQFKIVFRSDLSKIFNSLSEVEAKRLSDYVVESKEIVGFPATEFLKGLSKKAISTFSNFNSNRSPSVDSTGTVSFSLWSKNLDPSYLDSFVHLMKCILFPESLHEKEEQIEYDPLILQHNNKK